MWMHLRPLGRLPPHTPMAQVFLEKELLNQFPLEGTVLKKKKSNCRHSYGFRTAPEGLVILFSLVFLLRIGLYRANNHRSRAFSFGIWLQDSSYVSIFATTSVRLFPLTHTHSVTEWVRRGLDPPWHFSFTYYLFVSVGVCVQAIAVHGDEKTDCRSCSSSSLGGKQRPLNHLAASFFFYAPRRPAIPLHVAT